MGLGGVSIKKHNVTYVNNITMQKPEIVVTIKGGVIQSVINNISELKINIIDFDTEDEEDEDSLKLVRFSDDELNEVYVYTGGINDYDPQLTADLSRQINNETRYVLMEYGIHTVGSYTVALNERIKDEELYEYSIVDREDFINDLIGWIAEARDSDKSLMKQDLKMLIGWEDDYILTSNSTNSYIGKDSENFNKTCKALLELNHSIS